MEVTDANLSCTKGKFSNNQNPAYNPKHMPVRIRKKYLKRLLSLISYLGKQIYNYRPITPNICPYFSLKKWKNHPKEHKKRINNKKKRNQPQKVCNYTAFISTNQILLRNLHSKIRNPIFSFYPTQK